MRWINIEYKKDGFGIARVTSMAAAMTRATEHLRSQKVKQWVVTHEDDGSVTLVSKLPPIELILCYEPTKEKKEKAATPLRNAETRLRFAGRPGNGGWYNTHFDGEFEPIEVQQTARLNEGDYGVVYVTEAKKVLSVVKLPDRYYMLANLGLTTARSVASVNMLKMYYDKKRLAPPEGAFAVFLVHNNSGNLTTVTKRYIGAAPAPLNKYR